MQALPEASSEDARTALREVVGDGEYFHVYLPDGSQARVLGFNTLGLKGLKLKSVVYT